MRKLSITPAALVLLVPLLAFSLYGCPAPPADPTFGNPKRSAHHETNTPAHGATLAGVPTNIALDFNFDLGPGCSISVTSGGKEYGVGDTVIDPGKLSMRRAVDPAAPDGMYTVNYNACWPDGSCHDGNFRFAIDRGLASGYSDMTGKAEVTIEMRNLAFEPRQVRLSRNTRVTWVNQDEVEHFVNTDSHPAHSYYLPQNSRGLAKGQSFSVVFDKPGVYPYHCSAHTTMTAVLLVQ